MVTSIEIPTLPVAQIRAMSLISNPYPSFEELGDVVLDDLGRGALPAEAHGDGREVDVGQLTDAHFAEADRSKHDQPEH